MDPYRAAMPPVNYGYEQAQAAARAKDEQDLKVLAVLHFVYAGVIGFTAALLGLYMLVAGAFLASSSSTVKPGYEQLALMGTVFVVIFGSVIFFLVVKTALLIYSGLSLRKRERKLLSQLVAALACINVPFGTALGVYTLVVLSRPSVALLYARNRSA